MREIKGDLLEFFENGFLDAIGHCCNCRSNMGAGIAKSIKLNFPEAWDADKRLITSSEERLGRYSSAEFGCGIIFNLYGQFGYGAGRQVNYEALYTALVGMRDHLSFLSSKTTWRVGFPKLMASALAGGDWRIVSAMIESVFDEDKFEVTIVDFN